MARAGPRRRASSLLTTLTVVAAAAFAAPALGQDNGLGGFLLHLFGGRAPPEAYNAPLAPSPLPRRPKRKPRDFVPSSQTREPGADGDLGPTPAPTAGAQAAPPPAPVTPTFFVDVIGDSLAGQLVQGLNDDFTDRPEIVAQNKAKESSGLVRDDFYDWGKAVTDLAAAPERIDFIVVMIGSNDSQPMRDGADVLDPLSDRWGQQYQARVSALLAPFKAKKIPIVWVGLPPMRSDRLSQDISKINALARETAEKEGAVYIDLWDAFANQSGGFDPTGPDMNGVDQKLRGVDGVHFTKAGFDKAASFVAAEIKRAFDKSKPANDVAALPPDIEKAAKDINAEIKQESAPSPDAPALTERPLAGPILSLTTQPLAQDGVLVSKTTNPPAESAAVTKVLRAGLPPSPVPGRADDYSAP